VPQATVRAYGPLNDFLPPRGRQTDRICAFERRTSVKDLIERLGIPHPEVDLILINGESVDFDAEVRDADRLAVFPLFHAIDVGPLSRVRPEPLEVPRFILDGHLGRLARYLRLLGLDAAYERDPQDDELAARAAGERRILLTRDRGLLKRGLVTHGRLVRESAPRAQLVEVLQRFGPLPLAPFSRCPRCNALLRDVPKSAVDDRLETRTRQHYSAFRLCPGCGQVYWQGSHWARVSRFIERVRRKATGDVPRA